MSKQQEHYQNGLVLRKESDKVAPSPYLFDILAEIVMRETLYGFQGGLQMEGK